MLYPKSRNEHLDDELFRNPTSEYRGVPLWCWNGALDQDILNEEIGYLKDMGMGGFHIHPRVGLKTPYLSDEFLQRVVDCTRRAEEEDLLVYLYDEDKWPSGYAGGFVTKDPAFRQKFLRFSPVETADAPEADGIGRPLAAYRVTLDGQGCLRESVRIPYDEAGPGDWRATLDTMRESPWYNGQTYVDTLSKPAIERFVELTHERYKKAVGDRFGGRIPAIFTDEPQFLLMQSLRRADERREVLLPFTDDLEESYAATYGESLLDRLPELFWELPDGAVSPVRYRFHDHIAACFADAFAGTLGSWCRQNGILLTGHLLDEPTLESQTLAVGDAMRSYPHFGLPGIDMLCDWRELTTAKQTQSAVHQGGAPGMLSELYGVTGWDFDFRGHKLSGDWQAALGVTVRAHHLYWVSMGGEAKRDFPASIGHQSPWYREYPLVEDHFARVNTAMTRGRPLVRLGVIHPLESYWLHRGPLEQTRAVRNEMETRFRELTDWLVYGLLDFDFICEATLPTQFRPDAKGFAVGEIAYDAVLVPACETLRSSTLACLENFVGRGGRVIFAGPAPRFMDAVPSSAPATLADRCRAIPFEKEAILTALAPLREIDVESPDGTRSDNLAAALRADGESRWLFLSHVQKPADPDNHEEETWAIRMRGSWIPTLYDTLTGEIHPCPASYYEPDETRIPYVCGCQGSLLLRLDPGKRPLTPPARSAYFLHKTLEEPSPVTLSEPNDLLLDMAFCRIDEGEWMEREEILRIDNRVREQLGYPRRGDAGAQPWASPDGDETPHVLELRVTVESEIPVTGARLAVEYKPGAALYLNGSAVPLQPDGWYVDRAIPTVPLPPIPAGSSELRLVLPFGPKTVLEWMHLLGDFGVRVEEDRAVIIPPSRELRFDDWTVQGLPFYGGNVTYHQTVEGDGRELFLEIPQFRSPVITVAVDGARAGRIAFSPYRLSLGVLSPGLHTVDITVYGNRFNTFGALHNWNPHLVWQGGPDSYFTTGDHWRYAYHLRQTGILAPPQLYT